MPREKDYKWWQKILVVVLGLGPFFSTVMCFVTGVTCLCVGFYDLGRLKAAKNYQDVIENGGKLFIFFGIVSMLAGVHKAGLLPIYTDYSQLLFNFLER
ncbi:MAG: hypothetical protein CM1200mP16_09090 [Nitrospina sp.]|nr:MAG: hypothetical protein CM1200mP16_09090 [Nitrospina sp.]